MKSHLLVLRFSALGDVALAVPVVFAVAKAYPDVRITVVSQPFARTFFDDLAPNVNFMAADIKREYHGIHGLNALFRRLAAKQPTHVADLHGVLRATYLRLRFNLSNQHVAHIHKHRIRRRLLIAGPEHKRLEPLPTAIENYKEVFAQLGFPVETIDFHSIFGPEGGNLNMLPRTVGAKRSWEKWIGVAAFAAHEGKIYPPERMEQVIEKLIEAQPRARIFLFGKGKREDNIYNKWCERWPQCYFVSRNVETIFQELILMSHLDVMISMDSANMHLASLTGTRVVSIWGATHPYAGFLGWNQKESDAVQVDLPCRPCSIFGKKPCARGDFACMTTLMPETIAQKVLSVLAEE